METRLQKKLQLCCICYQKAMTKGRLNTCSHSFCFTCIAKWAKLKNNCPCCRVLFSSITEQLQRPNYSLRKCKSAQELLFKSNRRMRQAPTQQESPLLLDTLEQRLWTEDVQLAVASGLDNSALNDFMDESYQRAIMTSFNQHPSI